LVFQEKTTMGSMTVLERLAMEQQERNTGLVGRSPLVGPRFESNVLPFRLDLASAELCTEDDVALAALEKRAATIAIKALVSLAQAGDIDHLGGGLELIPALLMTLGVVDYDARHFTIEHGHTSIGYYGALSALGFLPEDRVIEAFRRSLDIAGHVSWVPGGTELSSGRLGAIVPVAVGQALGLKARKGRDALVVCHCGDAGWISGQALNGFVAASLHGAPTVFVMHRNGIQLSGTTQRIMPKDVRPIVASLGVRVLEVVSLHDRPALFAAYAEAARLATTGQPSLIYPVGARSTGDARVTVATLGEMFGIASDVAHFAAANAVPLETEIWIPGSLMSFRDVHAMLECVFYVNSLPGGEAHHDGGMKGKDAAKVLANPMLQANADESRAIERLQALPPRVVVTKARPARGTPNLTLTREERAGIVLPGTDKWVSPRAGSEAAYAAVARKYPDSCFFVSCDLNPSTKIGKAASCVPPGHAFEMSIQEQAASLMTNGLAFSSREPQINVFATFAAFFEGIAREGFEFWRYQRNLTGPNEGLNVIMHLSHVGANTGRDHFSGWSLDWINLGLSYLPYLRRFYAPADARAAFLAVTDAAAGMGGHIVAIPRDSVPVLTRQDTTAPLWASTDAWTPVTPYRRFEGSEVAVLALGAPSFIAGAAAEQAAVEKRPADVYVVNGFPLDPGFVASLAPQYRRIITIEDGLMGNVDSGLRGFAAYVSTHLHGSGVELAHVGISDPQIAPSEDYRLVWEHFGITTEAVLGKIL
jgi:transketolase N-terminal domain/subunit/transketolase C-terminal domain/subunit